MVIPNDGPSDNAWGVDLVDPVLVSHQQLLVLFARERGAAVGTLYFRVLDPSAASTGDDLDAWNGWYRYRFPEAQAASLPANAGDVEDIPGRELRLGGMELITVPPEAEPVASADAAFRVLSEGGFLSVYRQSAAGTVLLTRVGLLARSEDEEGAKVTRYALEPAWEVRFRRSGVRDVPLDRTDGQSYLDPVDDPFYEPTVELARIAGVSNGMFDVARVPSVVPEQSVLYLAVATATGVNLQQVRQSGSALVDYSDAPIVYPPIQPTLRDGGTALAPIAGLAPALIFYAEQEEATGPDGDGAELQRAGHLMLAVPVSGGGLTAAVALYDFALDRDGNIPVLPPQAQSVVLVDGTLTGGTFTPDLTAAHYPQSKDLAATVQVVDRLVVSSMVLGQVQPTRTPVFHFGDDGLVHLYYGGPPPTPPFDRWSSLDPTLPQAMVAQFDARANRLVLSVPWQESETEEQGNGAVDFVALQSGCTMTGATVAVSDGQLGDGPAADDLCTVRITYPSATTLPSETWLAVPRSLGPFMDALNGAASGDSADPDVLAGTQPFYDCSGRLPIARLPLVLPSGVGAGPVPKVTVASTRADLGLTSVTVTASGTTQDYAFTFSDAGGASLKVTWRGVPTAVASYRDVFDGAAGPGTYAYPPDATATPLFPLWTDAIGVPAPVILYPTGRTTDVTTVTVASGAGGKLDVTFARPSGDVPVVGLPAEVDKFVTQLRANPEFQGLHLGISSANAGGDVVPTPAPAGPMSLASTGALFDVLVPALDLTGAAVKVGPYQSGRQGHTFDPPADPTQLAGIYDPTRMVGFLATSVRPGTGATAYVLNRAPTEVEPSRSRSLHGEGDADPLVSGVWIRQPAHWQCGFTPTANVTVPVVADGRAIAASTNLRPQRDWTLEAWVRPDVGQRQRLLTFLDDKTPVADGAPKLAYSIALESQQVVCGQSYTKTPGNPDSSYFQTLTSAHADFMPAGGFTWEFWVKPDAQAGPPVAGKVTPIGGVIQVGEVDSTPFLTVGLTADRHVQVATFDDNAIVHTVTSDDTVPDADWSHIALTGEQQPGDKTWTLNLMIDADVDKTWASVSIEQQTGAFLTIGANTPDDATVFGRIAQLRYWSHARSAADIRRTWLTSVSGSESGLLGNWPLSDIEDMGAKGRFAVNTALITGADWDAMLNLFKHQVLTTADDSFFLSTVASVGGLPAVEADTLLANGHWNHLALVYQAGGGLAMNPTTAFDQGRRDWLDCGRADAVGTRGRFAIDTWIRVDKGVQGPIGTIMARWDDPGDAANQSFVYGLDDAGEMDLSLVVVADTVGTTEVLTAHSTGAALADGVTHHVAVVASWEPAVDPATGIGWAITFYKDGTKVGGASGSLPKATSLQVQSSRNDLTIGCAFAPVPGAAPMPEEGFSYLRATLGRTRVWVKVPELQDLFPERYPRLPTRYAPDGLAVQWSFREQAGRISVDEIGGIEAKLSTSAMRTSLADTSTLAFVANGAWVGRVTPVDTPLEPATTAQFTFGAPLGAGSPAIAGLQGDIAQVALFDEARSVETIQDQMYVPRWGDAASLVACWNFSRGGADITGGQNDIVPLLPGTRLQASTAPLTIEGPYVRNVYGGVMTDHSQSAPGRIAVGSYADGQDVGTARQRAVLKRQYVVDPDQTVARAIQIGELGLTYLGQVQTNPTLIGYIEGAPPVPSENLTRPYYLSGMAWSTYYDTAMVTLVQEAADTVTFTSSSSWATGVELSGAFGLMSKSTEAITFSWPGIGAWTETLTSNFKVQAVAKASVELGGSTGSSIQSVWGATQRDTMGINGDWEPRLEPPKQYLDPAIGRRFLVDNSGYALVQSLTADLYALTFRATGAAVGTIILPNPAIPPDRNIIVFPMNSQYTKNGTLDGKVGLANDPAYLDADERRRSLFRPVEAYALAGRIDRQQQRARSVADQFDPERKAHGWDTGLDDARAALAQDFSSRSADAVSVATPVQGLVNRYVWTADGGLHTEEEADASTSTHSYTGEIARGGGGGFHGDGEFYFKLGVAWSFDIMATHRVDVSVSKQVTSQQALHLELKVAGEALLRTYDPTAEGEYPPAKGRYLPGPTPGKVKNYRFMTFYLPPASPNSIEFPNIVDPVWLRMSNDNNARALRQLDASSPTWRVLHRVTYVERIPPAIASRPLYTPARSVVAPVNVEGNADLIRLVEAQVPASVTERTRLIVGNAVAATLNPAPKADHTYPKSALEQIVPWWGAFLDRARPVGDKPLTEVQAEAAALLHALVSRTTAYLYDGYASGAFEAILE